MRVAFISPSGYGNLGDAAIQDSFIDGVRRCLGEETEIVGITQNPVDTAERHHVRAIPMDTNALRLRRGTPRPGDSVTEIPDARSGLIGGIVSRLTLALKEVIHWGIAFCEMRGADALVVSGGGQLDDHWGGPWRVPYALWKWSLAARLLRKDVLFLSVGAGTTNSRLTRFFLRSALRRARYASFRDRRTAERVRTFRLSRSSCIVPDLAFGHAGRRGTGTPRSGDARRTIAISPIAFLDPVAWPAKDVTAYRANLLRTAALTRLLLDRGYDVVVCTSDTPDLKSAQELIEAVGPHGADDGRGALTLAGTLTPTTLLESFAAADVAVASRLHGLVLANLAGAPTIALSYDWKVDEHMLTMGLERYTFPIDSFSPEDVAAAVDAMLAERDALAAAVVARCDVLANEVREQFRVVFSPGETPAGSADPA